MIVSLPIIDRPSTALKEQLHRWNEHGSSETYLFDSESAQFVFVVRGSQLFRTDVETYARLKACQHDDELTRNELRVLGCQLKTVTPRTINRPISAISLAISQKCNLACSYCYADQGGFGQPQRNMSLQIAIDAVERLIGDAMSGQRVNIAFMGGEPLMNRQVLRQTTEHAANFAAERGVEVGFSITTNGTLITPEDGDFWEAHGFAVTISIDGLQHQHDLARPDKQGSGTFDRLMNRVQPLLKQQHRMQVSARSTITPASGSLVEVLDSLISFGFHSVGFSPMLSSPTGKGEMKAAHLNQMLQQMQECGERFIDHVVAGRRYPFLNIVNAMKEIHLGAQRALPCGAGDSYVGVGADGDYFACHRFVNDKERRMGSVSKGADDEARRNWLQERDVRTQEPCKSCWARYLCGGGCHHEVIHRGRPACEFIRGWLAYCLNAYSEILAKAPLYFEGKR